MARLSDARIRSLKASDRDRWVGDGMGLWLRVRSSGSKVFVLRKKLNGKTKVVTLGEWPLYSLARARLVVHEQRNKSDPSFQSHATLTVGELAEEFYSRIIEPRYRRTKGVRGYLDNGTPPALGRLKLRQVSQSSVTSMLKDFVARGPVAANRCLSVTKHLFAYAVEMGYLPISPASAITTRVAGGQEQTRDRVLSDA